MGFGVGLVCIGAAVMIVALAALAICGVVAVVGRLRDVSGARYSRSAERHGRRPVATPSRARLG